MTLPIDRTAKATLDANLVNGTTSDAPAIKASEDVVYNTIDELYNFNLALLASGNIQYLKTTADVTYYVNATTGNDANAGTTSGGPLRTIQAAINKIPQIVNHNIVINLAAGDYTLQLNFNLLGFSGKGSITINGGGAVGDSYLTPQVNITSCTVTITITGIRAVNTAENYTVKNSSDVTFNYCKADNITTTYDGFAIYNSGATIANSLINNKRSGIAATAKSIVYSQNNTGSANTYGLLCAEASKIGKNGTQPAGTTAENVITGGQIL